MAELGFVLDLDVAANASKGGRITTGVYKVEIIKAYVYKSTKGNNLIDLEIRSENGEVGFINTLCIDPKWESGAENFDYPKWQELAASARMKTLTLVAARRTTKNGEEDAKMIKELIGKVVNVAVYEEFDVYNNNEKRTLKLSNTFLEDGRSIVEAQQKKPAERIEKIKTRLSPFETKEYKAWKTSGGCQPAQDLPVQEIEEEMEDDDEIFG